MKPAGFLLRVGVVGAMFVLGGCVTRTWEDSYTVTEATAPVGSHHRRTYKYGEEIPPSVNPRLKIEGEGLRLLIDHMNAGR